MPRTESPLARLGLASVAAAVLVIPLVAAVAQPAQAALSSRTLQDDGDLVLRADSAATSIGVGYWGDVVRVAVASGPMTEYQASQVRRIVFYGGSGNDRLDAASMRVPVVAFAGGGADTILGGSARDQLNGGSGADTLRGNGGDDVIIAIDGSTADVVFGGAGRDAIWTDVSGRNRDRIRDLEGQDMNNAVARFANAGADRSLNGDAIPDPATTGGRGYQSFAGNPLFPAAGPSGWDPRQGSLSDCKTVAALSAVPSNTASGNAWPVRARMADFGDNTFGVRLGSTYYRLDADLPVNGDGTIAYVKLSANNALWAALAEKAMAHLQSPAGAPDYTALTRSGSHQVFAGFGSTATGTPLMRAWASSARDLGTKLYRKWNDFENVTISLVGGHTTGLVGGHAYTLWQVNRNGSGRVTQLVLRNPWGNDVGSGNPGYADANPNDGIVTVTPAQVWGGNGSRINWGTRIN